MHYSLTGGVFFKKERQTFANVILLENERLPIDLGWVRPATPIANIDLCNMTQRVISFSGATLAQAQEILPCAAFDVPGASGGD